MSTNKIIAQIEAEQMQKQLSDFSPGDTVVVQVKVKEGDRERLQAFEGVCIRKRNRALNSAFTVRKISHGVGVERTFQTYSPMVESIVGQASRRRAPGQALLPARPERPRGAHQGKAVTTTFPKALNESGPGGRFLLLCRYPGCRRLVGVHWVSCG